MADVSGFLFIAPQIPAGFEPHRSQLATDPISVFTLLASPVTANSHKYIWEWEKKEVSFNPECCPVPTHRVAA